MKKNLVFIGLGNPGAQYDKTRHNIGFDILNDLAQNLFMSFIPKSDGEYFEVESEEFKFYFFKPMTYMNNSGIPTKAFLKNLNIESEKISYNNEKPTQLVKNIFVFADDLDMSLNKSNLVKVKYGKGSHNGYKSLNENINGIYHKVNVAVDRPQSKNEVSQYVLSKFNPNQLNKIEAIKSMIVQNLLDLIKGKVNLDVFFKSIQKPLKNVD